MSNVCDVMAVWEYFVENQDAMVRLPTDGAYERRNYVATVLTPLLDVAWDKAESLGYDDSYDWEFVPAVLDRITGNFDDLTKTDVVMHAVEVVIEWHRNNEQITPTPKFRMILCGNQGFGVERDDGTVIASRVARIIADSAVKILNDEPYTDGIYAYRRTTPASWVIYTLDRLVAHTTLPEADLIVLLPILNRAFM